MPALSSFSLVYFFMFIFSLIPLFIFLSFTPYFETKSWDEENFSSFNLGGGSILFF